LREKVLGVEAVAPGTVRGRGAGRRGEHDHRAGRRVDLREAGVGELEFGGEWIVAARTQDEQIGVIARYLFSSTACTSKALKAASSSRLMSVSMTMR
jgi:hypothetical protein